MNFKVNFKSSGWCTFFENRQCGLKDIDIARRDVGEFIPLSDFPEKFSEFKEDPVIELSEQDARETGLFEEVNTIQVTVPYCGLNKFYNSFYCLDSEGYVLMKHVICKRCLIEEWKKDGFPTNWDI